MILGPNGVPISHAQNRDIMEIRPGTGGRVLFRESADVELPGGTVARFAAGVYLIIAEVDWDRMIAKTALELPSA